METVEQLNVKFQEEIEKQLIKLIEDFEETLDNGQNVINLDCGNKEKFAKSIIYSIINGRLHK